MCKPAAQKGQMTLSLELWDACLAKQPLTQRSQVCQSAL